MPVNDPLLNPKLKSSSVKIQPEKPESYLKKMLYTSTDRASTIPSIVEDCQSVMYVVRWTGKDQRNIIMYNHLTGEGKNGSTTS